MLDQASTLPVHYIRHIAEQLRSMGVDVVRWLRQSGLSEQQLDDPGLTISQARFEQLIGDALELSREPALGLFIGERLLANTHGMLGYAAMNSGSIREAMVLIERFMPLRTSLLKVGHAIEGEQVRLLFEEAEPLGATRRPLLEAVVLSIKNVLDSIAMGSCPVGPVAFTFPAPGYAYLARDLFGCEVLYGQSWNGFAVPSAMLDVRLTMADPEAFRQAALICQRELEKLTANTTFAARVRRLLLEKQTGFPSLQVTARLFHMTPRTLHRRLLDEGTSFRELLEEVRHTLAIEHLKAGRFSIEEIAYTLGYSDLANFRRAFRRWEGVPPSAFRTSHESAVSTRETRLPAADGARSERRARATARGQDRAS